MNNSSNPICVRRADMNDLPEICLLAHQLGYPNSLEDIQKRLAILLGNPDQVVFTVDTPEKKTAGYIHAHKQVSLETGLIVEVGGLVVNQKFHRQGLGKVLLSAAEEWAIKMGCEHIRLHSNIIREEAHQFYKDMGYSIVKTQYSFSKSLKI